MDQDEQVAVEFRNGPHPRRPGWELVRIAYDPSRPDHRRQVDAAIVALITAREETQSATRDHAG